MMAVDGREEPVWTPIDRATGLRVTIPRFTDDLIAVSGDPFDEDPPFRQLGKRGVVEWKGKQYEVRGISCGLPNCNCDAEIVSTESLGYMVLAPDTDALLAMRATGDLSRPAGCQLQGLVEAADVLDEAHRALGWLLQPVADDQPWNRRTQTRTAAKAVVTALCSLRILAAYSPSRESLFETLRDALGEEADDAEV